MPFAQKRSRLLLTIPVAHVIHKFLKSSGWFPGSYNHLSLLYFFYYRIQLRQQPFIHNRHLLIVQSIFCSVKFVDISVKHEESIGIPQGSMNFLWPSCTALSVETVWQPGSAVTLKYQRIASAPYFSRASKGSTAFPLDLDIFVRSHPGHGQNDDVFIRSLVEQDGRLSQQRVEPASCLVYSSEEKSAGNCCSNTSLFSNG